MKGDVAAGPTKRSDFSAENTANRSSFLYKSHVRTIIEKDGLKMKETFEWSESSSENEDNTSDFIKIKSIQLAESADVDSVDGSYSIDIPLLDLPPIISGTNMLVKFGIEHSLAISDNDRARCFLLYGMDDQLSRIVICNERKLTDYDENIKDSSEVSEMVDSIMNRMNLQGDEAVDSITNPNISSEGSISKSQDRLSQLQNAISKSNASIDESCSISRYPINIFALVGGVWLGDTVNHEHARANQKKGFGKAASKKNTSRTKTSGLTDGFAEWSTGVQKVAMKFQWDYGKVIRQKMSYGNAMGVPISNALPLVSTGEVILNEMMSRGSPLSNTSTKSVNQRMTYIDFDSGAYAACIIGSVFIKAPKTLSFSFKTGKMQNCHTEFAVFQKRDNKSYNASTNNPNDGKPSELFCSRQTRIYGGDGRLLQTSSSFFSLDRLIQE